MSKDSKKVLILGAGLAGLSAPYHSGYPVYEERSTPGGTADSLPREGLVFDFGIHVLHTKDPGFYRLMDEVGAKFVTKTRSAWIYSYGNYAAYPLQVNSFHLPWSLRFRCVRDFLLRKNHSKAANYEEWMIQNFGRGFTVEFLIPYAVKFWGVPPENMTYEWVGPRVPQPRTMDVIKGAFWNQKSDLGPNSTFHYPSKAHLGYAGIARAMASKIKNIYYRMKVTSIDVKNRVVHFNGGRQKELYDFLIATVPLPDLVGFLSEVPYDVRQAVSRLAFNSIAVVNIGVDVQDLDDRDWIHFPEKEISFFRISFPSNFCEGLAPQGKSLIQAEISYDLDNPPKKETLLRQVRGDLIKVGVLEQGHPVSFEDVVYLKYGYVIYDHHRKKAVEKIHSYLRSLDIYPCGRYGDWEYHWSDDAVISGQKAVQAVLQRQSLETTGRLAR
jgi:UDP-galactopyranose mutase